MEINENHNVMRELSNYNLLPNNTFGIEARCKRFLEYSSVADAQKVAQLLNTSNDPLLIIGGGSNLLLTKDFQGTVVHSTISGYETETEAVSGDILMRCGAGMTWDDVVDICVENGWHGAENLSLIPGEVGASAIQNIGAYGAEAKDIIIMDELGFLEKNSEPFKEKIFQCLNSQTPCIGILRKANIPWHAPIYADPNTKIIEVTLANRQGLPYEICDLLLK